MTSDLLDLKVYAYPNGKLVDLSADAIAGWRLFSGIRGVEHTDILADVGSANLSLKNIDKLYYPDGGSALSGFGNNIPIQIILVDENNVSYIQFKGYLNINDFRTGYVANQNRVDITLLDWMGYALETPIKSPNIGENQKINQALTTLLALFPHQPAATSFETGDYTFPTVFDNLETRTKIYNEFAKLAYSESPGHIYLTKPRTNGETLVSENSSHRDTSHALSSTTALTADYYLREASGNILREDGGAYMRESVTEGSTTNVEITDSDIDSLATEMDYGKNVKNYITVTAWPKRIDTDPQVLYALDYPMAIAAGETIQFRAPYTDQESGRQIGAIVSSMLDPVAPGATDTYRKLLCHFTSDTTDSTGNHTVTANDVTIEDDVFIDVGPEPDVMRISNNILGPYAIFGGYADYNLSVADSDDWEFGSGAFTIGFYAAVLNNASNYSIMARDGTTTYAPWVLGWSDGTDLKIFMSSNGSSWDMADGKSWGEIKRNRWVHYEIGRDDDGFFHAFADGKYTTDPWYSSGTFAANSNALSIGKAQGTLYMFMGLDELYIDKGRCLHTEEFEPPKINVSHLYTGDYWLNTAIDQSGTDNSSDLTVGARYTSNSVYYTVTNNNASAGFFYVQARGRGVYPYNPIDDVKENESSQQDYGVRETRIQQRYQQNLAAGSSWITDIITDEAAPRTRLKSISFNANRDSTRMARYLQCDVGDLIKVDLTDPGISGYYYIQSVTKSVKNLFSNYVTWELKEGKTPA